MNGNGLLNTATIIELRNRKGWTQQELADHCSFSLRTAQSIESEGTPTLENLLRLSKALGVAPQDLLAQRQPVADQPGQPREQVSPPMKRPLLTLFVSYSFKDRERIAPFIKALREANVEVLDFHEDEPYGANIATWVESHVAEADCLVVIISPNSLERPEWIEREIGLAMCLLSSSGNLTPSIIPVRIANEEGDEQPLRFQPRYFHSGEPLGQPIGWRDVNCVMPERDGVAATVTKFLLRLAPRTVIIKRPYDGDQALLFGTAIRLYATLLPDARERDREVDMAHWIQDSWDEDGSLDKSCNWLNVLAVHHIGGKVVGIFWCNVDRRSGIGFVSFWGLLASHRSHGRSIAFAQEVIALIRRDVPHMRALLFAAERVEWDILDKFLHEALLIWKAQTGKKTEVDWYRKLAEPLGDHPSALSQAMDSVDLATQEAVVEQLRRFRRFALYTHGANFNKSFARQGMSLLVFARPEESGDFCDFPHRPMADFTQPPIRTPVAPSNDCHLWLFGLVCGGANLTSAEAVDWVYDVFLRETLGQGRTALPGWNEYMVGFKLKWRDAFVKQAKLRHIRLGDWFAPYKFLLGEVMKRWLHEQACGRTEGRWDIQL